MQFSSKARHHTLLHSITVASLLWLLSASCHDAHSPDHPLRPGSGIAATSVNKDALLREHSGKVLAAARDTDFKALAAYIHPVEGLRLSPYGSADLFADQRLSAAALMNAAEHHTLLVWGSYAGANKSILLTPGAYFRQFVYTDNFLNADSVTVNRGAGGKSQKSDMQELYKNADYIEYALPKSSGHEWRALRLIWRQEQGRYYLLGMAHDVWKQ